MVLLAIWLSIKTLYQYYGSVQLVERVEHTCQGRLVRQFTFQYRDQGARFL